MLQSLKSTCENSPRLKRLTPLVNALDSFLAEVPERTSSAPFIRDGIDIKRIMMLVIFALLPCTLMALLNTGVQSLVYGSSDATLMKSYIEASKSFSGYFSFVGLHYKSILYLGAIAFLPVLFISYAVGGFWEVLFATIRGHEISEGLLVTGMLYALILPSTLPYWIIAVGISVGIIIGKEIFGGTGMNILNPALVCRCFIYFAYPNKMSGNVWVGTNPTTIKNSLLKMNQQVGATPLDGFSQASYLNTLSAPDEVKRIHIDAIGAHFGKSVSSGEYLSGQLSHFASHNNVPHSLPEMSAEQVSQFVTSPLADGGLGLSPDNFVSAWNFAELKFGLGIMNDTSLFFGNMLGSFGETSTFACLLGALFLILTGVASARTMIAVVVGTLLAAGAFQLGSHMIGPYHGAFNIARFDFPIYKQLLLGGLAFGLVFMATDPVSSPYMKWAKWMYGLLIGALTVVIRLVNPAFPEGVMLAILFGNVFSPLFDRIALKRYRRKRHARCAR